MHFHELKMIKSLKSTSLGLLLGISSLIATSAFSQTPLMRETLHLRNTGSREWSVFSEKADQELKLSFVIEGGVSDYTLELTQTDVKMVWHVAVNGTGIGQLIEDEKRTTSYFRIPSAVLNDSTNLLTIRSDGKVADDILVGDIKLLRGSVDNLMTTAIDVSVSDAGQAIIPARITVLNNRRSLQTLTVDDTTNAVVRPGCVYSARKQTLHVPPGTYTLYATRGFEYGVDSTVVSVQAGDHINHQFTLVREVDTRGWVSSDTHVHTFSLSKHGDATLRERVFTLAGEGIEMPVNTDHNIYADLRPFLKSVSRDNANVQMTPVVGDEVTTAVGHFNVLNANPLTKIIDFHGKRWSDVSKAIGAVGTDYVVILNHARDIHNDFRPFDPSRHVSCSGLDRDNWKLPANAMEVINSGSQQSDYMQLFRDWFGMLNAGNQIAPIGSSDSHDVNRFIVGQGRTYVKCNDTQPSQIDIGEAMRAISRGQVTVSCGLLVNIIVNQAFGPGDLAVGKGQANVRVDLLGPAWSHADTVVLFMNGVKIREAPVLQAQGQPIRQSYSWDVDLPVHDVFFAALAQGVVGEMPFWPIAKPYQPTSINWTPRVYAGTGAVWVDANGNKRQESAADYAGRLVKQYKGNLTGLFSKLNQYDEAVAEQVATLLWREGQDLGSPVMQEHVLKSEQQVRRGFTRVAVGVKGWR
jgi:hypothetical protein